MVAFYGKLALVASTMMASVNAHSLMTNPVPGWTTSWATNSFSGLFNGYKALPISDATGYSAGQQWNVDHFRAAWTKQTQYGSLKEMIMKNQVLQSGASAECGFTKFGPDVTPLTNTVTWTELTHVGPMEFWCGDKKIYFEVNVGDKSTDGTHPDGKFTIDASLCAGETKFVAYWLAQHTADWQVYIDCALISTSPGTSPPTTTAKPPTTTPSVTTSPPTTTPTPTPTPTTSKPPGSSSDLPPGTLACNYEGTIYAICRQANAWSFENGRVCVGVTRCVTQAAPYGVIVSK